MPDVVDRLVKAYNEHDLDGLPRCYAPRVVHVGPQGQGDGPEEVRPPRPGHAS